MRYKTPKQELYNKAKATIRVIVYDPIKNIIIDKVLKINNLKEAKEAFKYIDNLSQNYTLVENFEIKISIITGV